MRPDDYWAWLRRGDSFVRVHYLQDAIQCYDRTIEIDDGGFWGWCKRAEVLRQCGQWAQAIVSYDRAVEIDPTDATLGYNRACCVAQTGNTSSALGSLQQAFVIDPQTTRSAVVIDRDLESLSQTPDFAVWLGSLGAAGAGEANVAAEAIDA